MVKAKRELEDLTAQLALSILDNESSVSASEDGGQSSLSDGSIKNPWGFEVLNGH